MGESNNSHYDIKTLSQRDNNFKNFFKEDEIQILEKINNDFAEDCVSFFSNLLKNSIKLVEYKCKIDHYDVKNTITQNVKFFNLIEIFPHQHQAFIILCNNFLSITVDFLFGGIGTFKKNTHEKIKISTTDLIVNKKVITFITSCLSKIYNKYFYSDISFIYKKMFLNNETSNYDWNSIFLINRFNFTINNIDIFFDILIPKSTIHEINFKKNIVINHHDCHLNRTKNTLSLKDIHDVELNIITRIISIAVPQEKLCNLAIGDILPIHQPDKIIGYIDHQPIFFADYKRFNEQSIIFIEQFINDNVELNQEKEDFNE